jgi:hypothetical protein
MQQSDQARTILYVFFADKTLASSFAVFHAEITIYSLLVSSKLQPEACLWHGAC